jgi:phage antirepressor YoqD-like protein
MTKLTVGQRTMTSREIADLVESRHDSVKRSIDRLAESGVISQPPLVDGEVSANKLIEKVYVISQRDTYIIVAQLSPQFTARLVDRWQELEKQVASAMNIPTSLSGALRLAAEQAELIESQALQLEEAKPAINFVANHAATEKHSTFREVAKLLNANEADFRAFLVARSVMYRLNGEWVPYCSQMNSGRMVIKIIDDAKGKPRNQSLFTAKGVQWVAGEFAKFNLFDIAGA